MKKLHNYYIKEAKRKKGGRREDKKRPGDDLLSHRRTAVPLAKKRFTVVFGMGTGVSASLWSPGKSSSAIQGVMLR